MSQNTYAIGVNEVNADTILWIKVDAPDNKTFFTSLGETLVNNPTSLPIADLLDDLKHDFSVLGIFVDEYPPAVDHTPHLYDEADRTMSIFNEDHDAVGVTFQINTWLNRYGLGVQEPKGIPVQ